MMAIAAFAWGATFTDAHHAILPAGILINPAGVQSQVSGINLQPTVYLTLPTAPQVS